MGTAPQAIAGSAILRHMPRRMRRGHRRYSMRSGLIPPMRPRAPTAWPRLRRSSKPHQPCRGAWRRHRSAATRQSNVRCPESAKPALIGHDGRGTTVALRRVEIPCQLFGIITIRHCHRFPIISAMPRGCPRQHRLSHKCSTVLLVVQRAQELHLHHVGTVMVFVIHAHRGHRQVRAGTNMPLSTQTRAAWCIRGATGVFGHTGSPASASTWMASCTLVGTGMHCDCALPISSCSSLSSMAIRPGAISSLMMYEAAARSKWSHIHSA